LGEAVGPRQYTPIDKRSPAGFNRDSWKIQKGDVMQIHTLKRLIMLSVLSMLATVSAHAQSGKQFTVTIPFDFSVGGKALRAGQYLVGPATQTSAEALVLHRTDGRAGVFVLSRRIQTEEVQQDSKLVFRRYGDQYFLGEVWISGRSTGSELPNSRKERLIKQENARHGANPAKVAVASDKP
jgi:hypothetical protein